METEEATVAEKEITTQEKGITAQFLMVKFGVKDPRKEIVTNVLNETCDCEAPTFGEVGLWNQHAGFEIGYKTCLGCGTLYADARPVPLKSSN